MEREDGYYWVKRYPKSEWGIMKYLKKSKLFTINEEDFYSEDQLFKIESNRVLNPDKK